MPYRNRQVMRRHIVILSYATNMCMFSVVCFSTIGGRPRYQTLQTRFQANVKHPFDQDSSIMASRLPGPVSGELLNAPSSRSYRPHPTSRSRVHDNHRSATIDLSAPIQPNCLRSSTSASSLMGLQPQHQSSLDVLDGSILDNQSAGGIAQPELDHGASK